MNKNAFFSSALSILRLATLVASSSAQASSNLHFIPARNYLSTIREVQKLNDSCALSFSDVSSSIKLSKDRKRGYYSRLKTVGTEIELHSYIILPRVRMAIATFRCTNLEGLKTLGKLYDRK